MGPHSHRSLYDEAFDRFKKSKQERYTELKEVELLKEFLRENATPEETKIAAQELQAATGKKYGSKKLSADVEIPESWITNIMENIDNFITAGDYLTEGAPESVGLAWYAVKLTLTAIHSNYELYKFFGTALSDISEIMIIVRHYDRLYDERGKKDWKPSPLVEKLFQDVTETYVAVLDFSFAVKRHITAGSFARLKHGLKDFFGASKSKFEEKQDTIASLKKKILEGSQGAFQDKTLTQLEGVSTVVADIASSIKQFESFHHKIDLITQRMDELANNTKRKSPWDFALDDYRAYQEALQPLEGCRRVLGDTIDALVAMPEGTCKWVFDEPDYQTWEDSDECEMLCITGQEGTGKSYVVASVVRQFLPGQDEDEEESEDGWNPDTAYLYVTCNPDARDGKDRAITSDTILHTLLSQLYELALETKNASLLESCSAVFKTAKAALQNAMPHERERMSGFPEFVDGFCNLIRLLKRDVVVVVDGISKSTIQGEQQRALLRELRALRGQADELVKNHILILVGCSSPTIFQNDYEHDEEFPNGLMIDVGERNSDDLRAFLASELDNIPGLTSKEREEATAAILEKAQNKFAYLVKTAIPFMKEPFQRPLSKRLQELPGGLGDIYSKALRSLKPNYVGLLRTALTWVTLAKDNQISAREVMDDFQGTYAQSPGESSGDEADDDVGFENISSLEKEQLLQATEGILKLSFIDGRYILQAPLGELDDIEDYFCSSNKNSSEADDEKTSASFCNKCKVTETMHKALKVDVQEGHLQLALSCLRNLNNSLFQKRTGLVSIPKSKVRDWQLEVLPPTHMLTEKMQLPQENSEDEEDVFDPNFFDVEDWSKDDVEDSHSDSEDEPTQHMRYELLNWAYHVRKAEELLSPGERADSSPWTQLMAELDAFSSNTELFFAWQTSLPVSKPPEERQYTLASGSHKPLHVAAHLGLTGWAQRLLDSGSDVNEVCNGFTPIQAAASAGNRLEMIKLLLEKGADPNSKSKWGVTAFLYWIRHDQQLEGIQLFLQHGADPGIGTDPHDWKPLHLFAKDGNDPAVLDLLLEHGADINATEATFGFTPLHLLLAFREEAPQDLLLAFIKHKADINAENLTSARPLQMLATHGQVKNMEILLREGVVEIDDTDIQGTTALQEAIASWHIGAARLLLEHKANPNVIDTLQRTSLHLACRRGATEIAQLLIDHGCDVNIVDVHGWTPFFMALLGKNEGNHKTSSLMLDVLVQREVSLADINKSGRSGRTALRQAASRGFDDIVSKLIQVSAERDDAAALAIDAKDAKKGMAALHRAALGGHIECVRLLLEAKADASIQDSRSRTPLVVAYEQWAVTNTTTLEDTISLLISANPTAAIQDPELIATSAANGSIKLLRQLRSLNADFSRPDKHGWRPIELVRNSGSEEAEEFLQQQSTWVENLPSRWSTSLPGATALGAKAVQEDGITIQHATGKKVSISADKPLPPGLERYYYEITIRPPPPAPEPEPMFNAPTTPPRALVALGFSSVGGAGVRFPGDAVKEDDPNPEVRSWAYNSRAGEIYASDGSGSEFYAPFGEVGDTIGVGVDLGARKMWATKNGVKVGVYDDEDGAVSGRLFPIVGFSGLVQFETNFGGPGRGFVWKGEEEEEGDEEGSEGEDGSEDGDGEEE
ncbi:ankyrin repeat-containing domain protein [Triangularia verruculosa]|uniref:Ankyrin repeat-containing domain protein n=1 Tax=Triangularia verruculosa TaxID=2587418 RepID=A0AAN6XAD1_9PEZI|nr:ankyrin repeat-containing domain protein [Triangularia verruculosa]